MSSTNPKPSPSSAPDPAFLERMRPGPEHELLAKTLGTWDVAYTHWMKEGAAPSQAKGTAVFSSVFDGRYIREDFSGEFQGKEFAGVGLMGFNRVEKKFFNTWYDNMGTGIHYGTGIGSADGKKLTLQGDSVCPMTLIPQTIRQEYVRSSNDHFTLTMFSNRDGHERKTMELVYTRIS